MMKQVQGDWECHLMKKWQIIFSHKQFHTKDVAKDYWHEVKNEKINLKTMRSLGEMVKRTTKDKEMVSQNQCRL